MTEHRYTLEEARHELARQRCNAHGHSWVFHNHMQTRDPYAITCEDCGRSLRVVVTEETK